ncbi:MAG: TonB-dependent receptor [Acidobacteria bacterium]|nr:TonB-dependent receptor [Acidobacteriota bacterium]
MKRVRILSALALILAVFIVPASAQQTGTIVGKVVDSGGAVLPGVTVEASSNVLPTPRTTVTGENGDYRLPALPPGDYTLKFELSGMQTLTRQAQVQLQAETTVEATLGVGGVTETIEVRATTTLVDTGSASLKSGISNDQIRSLPIGQEYRDLLRLIPAVQVSQDTIRGPSAGGSGQDNVYQFDGVNVTLPLFGTLSAEPASHDIEQVTSVRGGARAVDFDRSGGFTIDSVSKSGTNRFRGMAQFQFQTPDLTSETTSGTVSRFDQTRTWTTGNIGGPVLSDKLFFFGSYYRPTRTQELQSNAYGELPNYESTRNEGFGKLTFTPLSNVLVNASYRDSKREDTSDVFSQFASGTSGSGSSSRQKLAIGEGSWVVNARSHFTAKYTRFELQTTGQPDFVSSATINTAIGTQIDLNALDTLGRFSLPTPLAGNVAQNAYIQPFIDRYGYLNDAGVRTGGGVVGYGQQFDDNDFFRTEAKVGYNVLFGNTVRHELHAGYQWYLDEEDLVRSSNGMGLITIPGGTVSTGGVPVFVRAAFQQQGVGAVPKIHSEYRSQNIELNDTIRWNELTVNLGLLASNDTLYGQGLRNSSSAPLSGYTLALGNKYEMLDLPFKKMLQPRVGATWAFNGRDTIYGSYARYNPAANSLPRAASWDRNLAVTLNADFDAQGRLFALQPVRSSSGKLFVDGIDPRQTDEFLLGAAFQVSPRWSVRAYGRYREGRNFWEDVNNGARLFADAPSDIAANGLFIPNLDDQRREIGNGVVSGSSYVIAELDGAYTKYREATVESEWRGERAFVRGSYTLSKYWGNFDQDNTTIGNDMNTFIGSSLIADGPGRQLWNFRDGRLRGDRPHLLKVYGFYQFTWNGSLGAFAIAQSGQPWEAWNRAPYLAIGGEASDSGMFVEPAGSQRSDPHYQMDLNYTQNLRLGSRYSLQLLADVYNVFDKQTGYSIQPVQTSATFGQPRLFFDPRRLQLSARFQF